MITTIVVLILCGVAAVILEMILPGGIVGLIGAILLVAAAVLSFTHHGATVGLLVTTGILLFAGVSVYFWMKNFHRLPVTKQMIVTDEVGKYDTLDGYQELIGQRGTVFSELRPSGAALFGDQKVDVIAQAGVIAKGSEVEVVSVSGPSVTVVEV